MAGKAELLTGIEGVSGRAVRRILPGGSALGLPQALSNWSSDQVDYTAEVGDGQLDDNQISVLRLGTLEGGAS